MSRREGMVAAIYQWDISRGRADLQDQLELTPDSAQQDVVVADEVTLRALLRLLRHLSISDLLVGISISGLGPLQNAAPGQVLNFSRETKLLVNGPVIPHPGLNQLPPQLFENYEVQALLGFHSISYLGLQTSVLTCGTIAPGNRAWFNGSGSRSARLPIPPPREILLV